MTFGLTPAELQALAELLKDALLPMLVTATESTRANMKMLTVDEVAVNAKVVRKTVENWITGGKLRAVANWGTDKRPMYRVSEAAYWNFYENHPVIIRKARARSGRGKR